ncbi:glycosyl hydrolase [Pseudaminobacter arsenicus]|uniref:Glycosyl hydrolase n=1 Tax=Borborobacter arsenicus TaxID=1851146 RepID=A0A432V0H8_9HYPH|nr:cellulase family glycosylhydrolase [Pseudaminobacter arsenicus]RUM95671.1 glycosyl hydrolase [Pseudaminobacter arsenicus]
MASLATMFKAGILVLALLGSAPTLAGAVEFSVKRGINLDIWTTWPDEKLWGDEAAILPYPEWRQFLARPDLDRLKQTGFDFVRMPVDPAPFLSDKTLALRDKLYASVQESVRLANEAGLKVVVDLHLIPSDVRSFDMGKVMDEPGSFDAYVEFVRKMAYALSQQDPALVAFEPMNEPVIDCDDAESLWPQRLQRLFAAARASATRLTLVLSGACYSSAAQLARIDPEMIADDNIIWTFHSYEPFLLTHQGATWAGDFIRYVTGLPYPLHEAPRAELDAERKKIRARIKAEAPFTRRLGMLAYLDEQIALMDTQQELDALMDSPLDKVAAWAQKHGISPHNILLGEFGMIRQEYGNPHVVPPPYRAAYVADMVERAERHGFAWAVWSYGGAFGVVDEFEGRRAEPDVLETVRRLQ